MGASQVILERVEAIRQEVRQRLRLRAELVWHSWVSGEKLDLAATNQAHEALFGPESIALAARATRLAGSEEESRSLRYLHGHLVVEHLRSEVADLIDRVQITKGQSRVSVDGAEFPYRDLSSRLANEPDYDRRGRIADGAVPVLARLNPIYLEKERRVQRLVRVLGYPSYMALAEDLRQLDLAAVARLATDFLRVTDDRYREALARLVPRELAIPLERFRGADVARLFKTPGLDREFPEARMMDSLHRTLRGLGIEPARQSNILVHAEKLPRKNPRAACVIVDVPADVRVSIKPIGGLSDWMSLFHEYGHAEHFAHTRTQVFEFQHLGSNAVTETYAFLFEGLLEHPRWLAENTGLEGERLLSWVASAAVKRLFTVRWCAGKVLYEMAWHGGAEDPRGVYGRVMSRAVGFPFAEGDTQRWLVDHDELFYSADYLLACLLEAQLGRSLGQRFGEAWWQSPGAGRFLMGLWASGSRLTGEELAGELGESGVDPQALLERTAARLEPLLVGGAAA